MTSQFAQRNLAMQGFKAVPSASSWLRMTPSMSTTWIATGTALRSPLVLLGFSLVSAFGASRRTHPFDQVYNRGLRRLTHGDALPENPAPRRFAMGLASAWAATTAALFATGHKRGATVAGALLALAGGLVASTHFCVGSFIYRQVERLRH